MLVESKWRGFPVLVDYELEYDKDFDYHYCRLNHVWKILPDVKDKGVKVDILMILDEDSRYEIEDPIQGEANQ